LGFQEFFHGVELCLQLLLCDPGDDRLAKSEEPARLAFQADNDPCPATLWLEGVGDGE